MNGLLCSFLLLRFPVKSICISSPGVFGGSIFDFSVWGIWNFRFLPALRQAEQVFDFFSISSRMFGHQNIAASLYILFIPGCPKCSALTLSAETAVVVFCCYFCIFPIVSWLYLLYGLFFYFFFFRQCWWYC